MKIASKSAILAVLSLTLLGACGHETRRETTTTTTTYSKPVSPPPRVIEQRSTTIQEIPE
jgi:hypothetical protein